jgi:hypothetical protein
MNTWRDDIERSLDAFLIVAELAGEPVAKNEIRVEFLPAPHQPPPRQPPGMMAVYGFWWDGVWLKIGKVGANSQARYIYQHYNAGSAQSTLAGSLTRDDYMLQVTDFDPNNPDKWIRASTCRVNILLPAQMRKALLSLLEAFLHARLKPRYEG